jgi:hypothetical protein
MSNTRVPRQISRPHLHRALIVVLFSAAFFVRGVGGILFAALALLEHLVRLAMVSLAALGVFVTVVFGFLLSMSGFPKWLMLGVSGACLFLLWMYDSAITFLRKVAIGPN